AEMPLVDRLAAGRALGVGAQIEAEVDGARDGFRIAAFLLAPLVDDAALVLPLLGPDVGAVPAVGPARDGAERALLAAAADPDGDAGLERLGVVRRILELEVLAGEAHPALLGIEEHAHDLRVLLQHVLADADRREVIAKGLGLDLVPARAE